MMSKHDNIFSRGDAGGAENIGFQPTLFFSASPRETLFGSGSSGLGDAVSANNRMKICVNLRNLRIELRFLGAVWLAVPQNQFHASIHMLDDGGAAIHPVAAIDVGQTIDFFDHGPVDVAANCTVHAKFARMANN